MNKNDVAKLHTAALNSKEADPNFSMKSGLAADALHAGDGYTPVYLEFSYVLALFKWQCLQFNGELDVAEVNNTLEWFRRSKLVIVETTDLMPSTIRAGVKEVEKADAERAAQIERRLAEIAKLHGRYGQIEIA